MFDTIPPQSNGHARLGPSNHRWPHCPGSIREEANYVDIAGEAAIDGTGSHELLEICLKSNTRAEQYIGQTIAVNHPDKPMGWVVHEDRAERVQMCLDYVARRVTEIKNQYPFGLHELKVESESKSDPGAMFGRDDWWGTVDITITATDKNSNCLFMEIIDYKDGRVWVHVEDNTQLFSYLAGKLRPFIAAGKHIKWVRKANDCRVTIVQPKTNTVIRYQDTTAEYCVDKAKKLAIAAEKTDDPNAPLIPDDKGGKGYCRWCKHRDNCTAESENILIKVENMSQNLTTIPNADLFQVIASGASKVEELTEIQLADLADVKHSVQAVFDKIESEIKSRIKNKKSVPGYEMLSSGHTKKYSEHEEEVVKAMRKAGIKKKGDMYPSKLISPAEALKLIKDPEKKKLFKETCISEVANNKSLKKVARKNDKPTPEMMFGDVAKIEENVVQSTTDSVVSFL